MTRGWAAVRRATGAAGRWSGGPAGALLPAVRAGPHRGVRAAGGPGVPAPGLSCGTVAKLTTRPRSYAASKAAPASAARVAADTRLPSTVDSTGAPLIVS